MAFITFSGYPCSGKTRRVEQLKAELQTRLSDPSYNGPQLQIVVLSDDILSIDRSAYNDSRAEKPARGALFTALQRVMGPDKIVIADGMNYIKGFRYQMYCAAREFKLRVCTVHVVASAELCKEWNLQRVDNKAYNQETLDNLIMRYEEPSSMVRWDSPLFTVPWTDVEIPADDIWKAITQGVVKPPNVGTQAVAKAPTDALHTLEQTATAIVSAIMTAQSISPGSGGSLSLQVTPTVEQKITLPARPIMLSELQRLKRQFVTVHKKAIVLNTTEKGAVDWSEGKVSEKFVTYLEENLRT